MAKRFGVDDFISVKKMQNSRWSHETIVHKMAVKGWSPRTTERAMRSDTYSQYKKLVAKETSTIRERREVAKQTTVNDSPLENRLIDDGPEKPQFSARKWKRDNSTTLIIVCLVVLVLAIWAVLSMLLTKYIKQDI